MSRIEHNYKFYDFWLSYKFYENFGLLQFLYNPQYSLNLFSHKLTNFTWQRIFLTLLGVALAVVEMQVYITNLCL